MLPPLIPFRDAAFSINTFPCSVLDCCRALRKAVDLKHFSLSTFSIKTFANLSRLENGDLSWIIPEKFIAFSGPLSNRKKLVGKSKAQYTLSPDEYIPVLKDLGVTCIVRFNSKCYDKNIFTNAKFRHVDLMYDDGANPPEAILQSFLRLCEDQIGVIAVHCKAGLGRTGTNISAYLMKHYGYTAKECVAWCRMCRPGCVVGPQQQFLIGIEARMNVDWKNFARTDEENRNSWKSSLNPKTASISFKPFTNNRSLSHSWVNGGRYNFCRPSTSFQESSNWSFQTENCALPVLPSSTSITRTKTKTRIGDLSC